VVLIQNFNEWKFVVIVYLEHERLLEIVSGNSGICIKNLCRRSVKFSEYKIESSSSTCNSSRSFDVLSTLKTHISCRMKKSCAALFSISVLCIIVPVCCKIYLRTVKLYNMQEYFTSCRYVLHPAANMSFFEFSV
jgi:hypothetical protein